MVEDGSIHHVEYKICGLIKKELTSCGKASGDRPGSNDGKKITCHLCIDILEKKNENFSIQEELGV